MSEPVHESGLFASLRRLLATALEIAQVRLELLGTEVELEKQRLLRGLFWAALALMVLGVGLVLLCGFVILLFWEGYRLHAAGVMSLLFLVAGAWLMQQARAILRNPTGLFKASAAELEQDRAGLRAPGQHEQQ